MFVVPFADGFIKNEKKKCYYFPVHIYTNNVGDFSSNAHTYNTLDFMSLVFYPFPDDLFLIHRSFVSHHFHTIRVSARGYPVATLSVFPRLPNANSHVPVYPRENYDGIPSRHCISCIRNY